MTSQIWKSLQKKRRISAWYALVQLIILVALALGAGGLAFAGRNLAPPEFKITQHGLLAPVNYPLWRRTSDWLARRKYIMLTFDDGPYGHGVDAKILSILAKHHAHAVFFEVCAHINSATRHIPKQILATGNMLGNHTYNHLHLPKLGPAALQHQIAGCSSKLAAVAGVRLCCSGHRGVSCRRQPSKSSIRLLCNSCSGMPIVGTHGSSHPSRSST